LKEKFKENVEMKNSVQAGKFLDYLNGGSAISSGDVVAFVSGVGIAAADIANGETGALAVEGVFELAKKSGETWAFGDRIYWDSGTSEFTNVAGSNLLAGYAVEAAGSSLVLGKIKLIELADSEVGNLSQAANVAALAGTLTGTADGTLEDVPNIALSTSDTYTDAAVNSAVNGSIAEVNEQLKELQTTMNAILSALVAAGLMASP